MQHDKKVQNGCLRLILLKRIGQAIVSEDASLADIRDAITSRSSDG